MKQQTAQLAPLSREEFRTNFAGNRAVEQTDPLACFEPLINHFRKMALGPGCWLVADSSNGIIQHAGGAPEQLTDLGLPEIVNQKPDQLLSLVHPADITHLFAFAQYWISCVMKQPAEKKNNLRPDIYLRMKNPAHQYNWVMIQFADMITDADGKIAYGLILVTDISHIKYEGTPMMNLFDRQDNSCRQFVCHKSRSRTIPGSRSPVISAREMDVLRLLVKGQSSKQIAIELQVSVKTIDNHRQSMLKKTHCKSSGELVAYAIKNGYL